MFSKRKENSIFFKLKCDKRITYLPFALKIVKCCWKKIMQVEEQCEGSQGEAC